jgi:hypothetical protein
MKGGVLIIGSLLWQDGSTDKPWDNTRRLWRDNHLKMETRQKVYVPIRYGRYSNKNEYPIRIINDHSSDVFQINTNILQRSKNDSDFVVGNYVNELYTMTYSTECDSDFNKMGTAFLIELNKKFSLEKEDFIDELTKEVKALSKAEGIYNSEDNYFTTKWGMVSVLVNEESKMSEAIYELWQEKIDIEEITNPNYYKRFKQGEENSVVNQDGTLNIAEIKTVEGKEVFSDYDFILTSVTVPKSKNQPKKRENGQYPTSSQIGEFAQIDLRRYFQNNVKNGITTFQDAEIQKRID